MPEEFDNEGSENLNEPPPFFPLDETTRMRGEGFGELLEVQVEGVFQADTPTGTTRFVLLTDGERRLPIMIGGFEAGAINMPLEGGRPDRPMTHDLIRTILDRLDWTVDRVVIDDLWNGIYYAKIYLKHKKEEIEIDARPSDAIAVAVRFSAAIFVADEILAAGNDEL